MKMRTRRIDVVSGKRKEGGNDLLKFYLKLN